MRGRLPAALVLALAGCLGPSASDDAVGAAPEAPRATPVPWTGPDVDCGSCYEPTLASDGESLYLTATSHEALLRGRDGMWETLPPPPTPEGASAQEGDIFVQVDASGRLWWHALNGQSTESMGVRVARSDDQGLTWAVNQLLTWGPAGGAVGGAADRNWLAVDGDRVFVFCTCPVAAVPQVRISDDAGVTFGPPQPIAQAFGRPGPIGPPAIGPDGTIVVPFFVGAAIAVDPPAPASLAVAAVVSSDGGRSWTRVDVAPTAGLVAQGGTACCAFPNSAGGLAGFLVAFAAADGNVMLARSADGLAWDVENLGGGTARYPHPWPLWLGDEVAVAWHGESGSMQIYAGGAHTELGASSALPPGDYVTAAVHQGQVLTAWPREDGLGVGGVAVAVQGAPSPYPARGSTAR